MDQDWARIIIGIGIGIEFWNQVFHWGRARYRGWNSDLDCDWDLDSALDWDFDGDWDWDQSLDLD